MGIIELQFTLKILCTVGELSLQLIVPGIDGTVVLIDFTTRENHQTFIAGIAEYGAFVLGCQLVNLCQYRAIEIGIIGIVTFEVILDDIIGSLVGFGNIIAIHKGHVEVLAKKQAHLLHGYTLCIDLRLRYCEIDKCQDLQTQLGHLVLTHMLYRDKHRSIIILNSLSCYGNVLLNRGNHRCRIGEVVGTDILK